MTDKIELDRHKAILQKLLKTLNANLVTFEGFFKQGIVLSFSNGFKVFINPFGGDYKNSLSVSGLKVIQDPNFDNLNKILTQENFKGNYEDGSGMLQSIINAFSKGLNKNSLLKHYNDLHTFELKDLFRTFYKIKHDPKKEVFLFGDDEIRPRFKEGNKPKIPLKGVKVKIEDKSALLMTRNGKNYLDLFVHGFKTKDKIYLGPIYDYQECTQEECDIVSFDSKTKDKKYKKIVLKPGIKLEATPYIDYIPADGITMLLKKEEGTYYFIYKNNRIEIHHPDLKIYMLD